MKQKRYIITGPKREVLGSSDDLTEARNLALVLKGDVRLARDFYRGGG